MIPAREMAAKVARGGGGAALREFLIIARTDARAVEGLPAALERARRYREAGADVLFVEAPQSIGEIEAIAAALPDVPLLFNYAEGGKTPPVTHAVPARARLQAGDLPDQHAAGRHRGDAGRAGADQGRRVRRSRSCHH